MQAKAQLNPSTMLSALLDEIASCEGDALLVGHMPWMAQLIAQLVTGDGSLDVVSLQTGTMTCLERKGSRHWVIRWIVTPAVIIQ
jgi:phosphohistidine phosphatase SixA